MSRRMEQSRRGALEIEKRTFSAAMSLINEWRQLIAALDGFSEETGQHCCSAAGGGAGDLNAVAAVPAAVLPSMTVEHARILAALRHLYRKLHRLRPSSGSHLSHTAVSVAIAMHPC